MLPPGHPFSAFRRCATVAAACLVVACPAAAGAAPRSVGVRHAARPVSFLYDVAPILSRAGCNNGNCHGNSEGRGGFKLSLKGEDPEGDHAVLTAQAGARRVNRQNPGASLI